PRHRYPPPPAADLSGFQSVAEASSVLAAIILVHESGHFLAASLLGIRISQFAIGFGPPLARFSSSSGIEFSLRSFPLGGYVAFPDADDPEFPESGLDPDDPDLLRNRPLPHRFLVVSAGVAANLLFAYLVLFSQCLSLGAAVRQPLPGILIPEVRPLSPAAVAGLLSGDVILDGPSVYGLVDLIKSSPGKSIPFQISRQTIPDPFIVNVVPDMDSDGTGRIGVQLSPNFTVTRIRPANIFEAIRFSGKEFVSLTATVLDGLKETFMNFSQTAGKVAGPVAIIATGAEVARLSSDGLFQFAAVINLNLAVINLLPLPALDGGTLALLLVEAARGGRKLPRELEQRIMSSGIMVVLMLGLILIVRDTLNLDFVKEML
ncbi:membrane metalloprotease ARASP, chloroplastic-like, partial [Phalaenopsis equestris]|uniref:membrane metalloprotease ARASP, chloroplastic-like n=1 Tax=Phalaenopsis equestris TaxID=78828 RepID=UPI0009E24ED7